MQIALDEEHELARTLTVARYCQRALSEPAVFGSADESERMRIVSEEVRGSAVAVLEQRGSLVKKFIWEWSRVARPYRVSPVELRNAVMNRDTDELERLAVTATWAARMAVEGGVFDDATEGHDGLSKAVLAELGELKGEQVGDWFKHGERWKAPAYGERIERAPQESASAASVLLWHLAKASGAPHELLLHALGKLASERLHPPPSIFKRWLRR
jgi:hypothetical protein